MQQDFEEMEGALMNVETILINREKALIAEKEMCVASERAVKVREKAIKVREKAIKIRKKAKKVKEKAVEAREEAVAAREEAIEAKENAIAIKENSTETREKYVEIMAPTAAIGKKRDFMAYGEASEAAWRKKARVGVPATREPNVHPAVLHMGVINKFVTFWKGEADKLQKGLDVAENPEVGILARAKELILGQYIFLQINRCPKQEAHSAIAQGVRTWNKYSESSPTIITELLVYLADVEDGKL